ncbi:hypothetical protein SVIOM342S_05302 [Streptomyces violaceorubidus]
MTTKGSPAAVVPATIACPIRSPFSGVEALMEPLPVACWKWAFLTAPVPMPPGAPYRTSAMPASAASPRSSPGVPTARSVQPSSS